MYELIDQQFLSFIKEQCINMQGLNAKKNLNNLQVSTTSKFFIMLEPIARTE